LHAHNIRKKIGKKGRWCIFEGAGASGCEENNSGASCIFAPFQELAQRRF